MASAVPISAPYAVLGALIVAYIPHFYRTYGVVRPKLKAEGKTYDVRYPRQSVQLAIDSTPEGLLITKLTGCHQNSLEAFAYFAVGVLLCIATGVDRTAVDFWATFFLAARIVYTWVYCTGEQPWKGPARSVCFAAGLLSSGYMMVLAGRAYSGAKL